MTCDCEFDWFGIVGVGLEVSGIQVPLLGYSLMGLGVLLLAIPFWPTLRRLVNDIEIKIIPNKWLGAYTINGKQGKNPSYHITPGHSFSAIFGLILYNHNQQHKVHIDSADIMVRKKICFWNGRVLFSKPLVVTNRPNDYQLQNIDIDPQSTREWTINTGGDIPMISPFPRRSRLILALNLTGKIRRVEHTLEEIRHDPQQVHDIPDWEN